MQSAAVRIAAAVTTVLAAGLLASCGAPERQTGASEQPSAQQADHNADDVAFVRAMVAHRGQAVQMAQTAQKNTSNQQLIDLADRITKTQFGETQAFNAWLLQWPEGQSDATDGHDAAGHGTMPGMVDAATMARLGSLTGTEFDRLWLTSMIDHHRGAIAMAQNEIAHGKNPDVIYLARTIVAGRQAEIDQMKQMLGG